MWRYYQEHPEFGEFSRFNVYTGELQALGREDFGRLSVSANSFSGLNSATRTNFPRRVYFQITRRCNLMCDYCFIKAHDRGHHLDRSTVFNLADYFGRMGLMEVRLTGGEPTLHPSFLSIVDRFHENNIYVSVATNGMWSRAIRQYFETQRRLWLIVSIDGAEETHNRYRRNSYAVILRNLIALKHKNPTIRLRINTVLGRYNRNDLEHLALLVREVGAESITLIPLRPQVRNAQVKMEMLSALEFRDAIKEMVELRRTLGVRFTTTIETEFKDEVFPDKVFAKRSSCAAGREGTNLDFDAERRRLIAFACSYCPASDPLADPRMRRPFIAGEFPYQDITTFGKIWEDDSNWVLFRDLSLKSLECQSCPELGTRCTGSCPIQNCDYESLVLDGQVKRQLMDQMKSAPEWYCYKNLKSQQDSHES